MSLGENSVNNFVQRSIATNNNNVPVSVFDILAGEHHCVSPVLSKYIHKLNTGSSEQSCYFEPIFFTLAFAGIGINNYKPFHKACFDFRYCILRPKDRKNINKPV